MVRTFKAVVTSHNYRAQAVLQINTVDSLSSDTFIKKTILFTLNDDSEQVR